jgi:hypothetical protein
MADGDVFYAMADGDGDGFLGYSHSSAANSHSQN